MQLDEIRKKLEVLNAFSFAKKIGINAATIHRFRSGGNIKSQYLEKIINGLKDLAQ